jgi:CspA family cold shock protein
MIGTIKWFSAEKGFGFLSEESGSEYYFNALDFKSTAPPCKGDRVHFISAKNLKGPRACQVVRVELEIERPTPAPELSDSRVRCRHCQKLMVPRVVMGPPLGASRAWTPVPKSSICPFCAQTHQVFPASRGEQVAQIIQWVICAGMAIFLGLHLLGVLR